MQNVLHDGVASAEEQRERPEQVQPEANGLGEKLERLGKQGNLAQIVVEAIDEPQSIQQQYTTKKDQRAETRGNKKSIDGRTKRKTRMESACPGACLCLAD